MTSMTESIPLMVPLDAEAHRLAAELAAEQSTPKKGKQVYLNSMAVYAVRSYLQGMEWETDLHGGDSWSPYLSGLLDATDLVLPGKGRLECRPVLPGETTFTLPMDVPEDLIGYVAVQLEEPLDLVQLLGFFPAVAPDNPPEVIEVADLLPIDALTERLEELEAAAAPSSTLVNLSQWLQDNFAKAVEAGWQTMEEIFGSRQASLAVRYAAGQRSKLIDLGIGNPVALIIAITEESEEEEITVLLQLRPTESQTLPSGLKLILRDASGDRISESTATEEDEFIQGQYSCQPGVGFTVTVALGDVSVTENFTF